MKEKKYTIKNISDEQINVIISALDTYSRLGSLQFEEAIIMPLKYNTNFAYPDNRDAIELKLAEIRHLMTLNNVKLKDYPIQYWNLGIYNDLVPHESQSAFDMYQIIRQVRVKKSLLKATNEDDVILEEMNLRKEKFTQLKNKIKKDNYNK